MCDEPYRPCTTVSGLLPPACCPANGLTLPSCRLLLYLFMPADMAAISFGPNIIIGSVALIANVSLCTSQHATKQRTIGLGYPCEIKCKKLSETTIAFSNVKLLPRPSRHEDIRSAWVHSEPWRNYARGCPSLDIVAKTPASCRVPRRQAICRTVTRWRIAAQRP